MSEGVLNRQACPPQERLIALVEHILGAEIPVRPVPVDSSLSDLGLSSMQMVELMLAVEAEFDLMIPEEEINPENFLSIASIEALVTRLIE